jgi:hypothetical protein
MSLSKNEFMKMGEHSTVCDVNEEGSRISWINIVKRSRHVVNIWDRLNLWIIAQCMIVVLKSLFIGKECRYKL